MFMSLKWMNKIPSVVRDLENSAFSQPYSRKTDHRLELYAQYPLMSYCHCTNLELVALNDGLNKNANKLLQKKVSNESSAHCVLRADFRRFLACNEAGFKGCAAVGSKRPPRFSSIPTRRMVSDIPAREVGAKPQEETPYFAKNCGCPCCELIFIWRKFRTVVGSFPASP